MEYHSAWLQYDELLALTVNPMCAISDLSDYPAIRKLASALYKLDSSQHGAAIMIGAGFSRSAAHHVSGEKKMPLWNDFSQKLAAELNPNENDISFLDPLRVAEEYRAYFGQAAFNDRIRSDIDDDAWRVGELYKSLLELPWSEIMTTNWDTLLERAASNVHRPYYTPVTKPSDLAWAPSPRIVKLHGTIGITETFIGAQEDYRTYPTKFAPFVNFARQVFIENELCLLGFSGDDPNFLQWSGWVRDHLAGHARKIYLVGALNLTAARRKHLELMNVSPIDLWNAVKHVDDRDNRHRLAIELFLRALNVEGNSKPKPHEWNPGNLHRQQVSPDDHMRQFKEPEYAASLLAAQLEALRVSRESYPGWLVCPPSVRWQIRQQLNAPFPTAKNVAALTSEDRAKLLYEIAWRYNTMWEYIPPWLADAMARVANPDEPCVLSNRQQLEICVALLRNSRWLTNESTEDRQLATQQRIDTLVSILERHAQYLPDAVAEVAYHKALTARDALNYAGMDAAAREVVGEDPVWQLRQAALLTELGKTDEADQLVAKAYGDLREFHRRDRNSIPILSRLMWAHWLLASTHQDIHDRPLEKLPAFAESMYREWQCDPWTWIENIRSKAIDRQEKYLKNRNPIEPSFEQGTYRDNSKKVTFSNGTSEFLMLDGLTTNVGIPLRSGGAFFHINLLSGTAEKLVLSGGLGVELWDYTWAIRTASSESSLSIKDVFTRIGVANISKKVVDTLVDRVLKAIDYWGTQRNKGTNEQQGQSITMLRVQMEVLARLVVRVSPEKAKEIFRLAISIGKQTKFQHHWLPEVIDGLITHSLDSIPKVDHGELLPEILDFPLPCEVVDSDSPRWPNPAIDQLNARATYLGLERRIDELIGVVTTNKGPSGSAALERLLVLAQNEFLTANEQKKLACALWGDPPDYQALPASRNLLPHAFLFFPASDLSQVKRLVYEELYEHGDDILAGTLADLRIFPSPQISRATTIFAAMANAAINDATQLFPESEHALMLFDRLVKYRPAFSDDEYIRDVRKQVVESIGNALSYAITPALSDDAKTVERFRFLQAFIEEAEGAFSAMMALTYFMRTNEDLDAVVEQVIRKALQRNDSREVSYAALALNKWIELTDELSPHPSLDRLIARVIVIIESGRTIGLEQLIWVAGQLIEKRRLSQDQAETLVEAIPNLFAAMDYANIEATSREAISASTIREACVKVAELLARFYPDARALQDMLSAARTDALPEVRFAVGSAG